MKIDPSAPFTDKQRERLTRELERAFKRHEGHQVNLRLGKDGTHYCPQCYPRRKFVANWLRRNRLRRSTR